MKRRLVIKFCIFLLLGAVVNVAMAWGFATLSAPTLQGGEGVRSAGSEWGRNHTWSIERTDAVGIVFVYTTRGRNYLDDDEEPFVAGTRPLDLLPYWLNVPNMEETYGAAGFGVPLTSMCWRGFTDTNNGRIDAVERGIVIGEVSNSFLWRVRALPLEPIIPGFAINTFFYATILWLLFAFPFTLRRWRRIRRGLCAKCAYPVGPGMSDVCPECGTSVAPRRSRDSRSVIPAKAGIQTGH